MPNPFDRIAEYYDWEHAEFLDDLPFYLGLAERVGGPVLEAACGSGRLAFPLARAGFEVVGLDSSAAMLALAQARVEREALPAGRLRLVQADLRSARLTERFGLAIVALDSFGLLIQQEDQLRALATLRRHLTDDGLLALDLANGNLRGGEAEEETVLQRSCSLEGRGELAKWVRRRTDHAEQLDELLYLYDEARPDGTLSRVSAELQLRYFGRFELELLLDRAGFFVEALFGNYDLTPFGSHSERLIAIAHVRQPRRASDE
jgi:SAM-dependent methyltransferase